MEILSFGAGVQSTTLLYLSLSGQLPQVDHVIFADTGWEPAGVYAHAQRCAEMCSDAGIPFHIVQRGNLRADTIEAADRQARGERGGMDATIMIPLYARDESGSIGMMRRFCTSNYKVAPVMKKIQALRRAEKKDGSLPDVSMWLGISLDEIERMKHSHKPWLAYRHPLAWELRWSRQRCLDWIAESGLPMPPRSACIGCPYKSNAEWRHLRDRDPAGWRDAVALDEYVRSKTNNGTMTAYLHRSGTPLATADLSEEPKPLFTMLDECDGMCGI